MNIPTHANIPDPLNTRKRIVWICCLLSVVAGCVAGIPSVPDSPDEILKRADAYFQEKKYFQSQELYKAFLARHPGHDRSDYAQFMLGESIYADEDYALASVEYRILVTNYGYSEYVDEGYLKEALCLHKQAPKSELDQSNNRDALSKLERFVQIFPQSPLMPDALRYIEAIKTVLARKELATALFYISRKRFDSALIYLDKVIKDYPNNAFWVEALYHKARIYADRERADEAIQLLSQALEYPDDVEIKTDASVLLKQLRGN
ncbi:MAG: outer membrane protein assembly factor BamD [Candidatus Krumholzibacteriia bacterium]